MFEENQKLKGPLCFVTAECGCFSTVGGVGVLIDDLTKGLSKIGENVIVITPYY